MKKTAFFLSVFSFALIPVFVTFAQQGIEMNPALFPDAARMNDLKPLSQIPESGAIIQASKDQIQSLIKDLPEEQLEDYGFYSKAEFKKITFDDPFRVYTVKGSNIEFNSAWRVPVVVDNVYRALLTVIIEKEVYKVVDFGACLLAKELSAKKTNQSCGLLRVYELRSDFLIEEFPGNQIKFVPVQGPKEKNYDLVDILNMIKNN